MGLGSSWGGAFGIGTETTFGTYATPTTYLPIVSESIKGVRPSTPASGIYTTRVTQFQLPGIISANGNFVMEADGHHLGLPFLYWNGQISSASFAAYAAVPTVSAGAGGTLAAGTYFYQVASILQRTSDSNYYFGSGSGSSLSVTTVAGTQTVTVAWANPATIPAGFTQYGTAIFRTAAAGLAGSEKIVKVLTGVGTTTTDDGSLPLGTAPVSGNIYEHTYTPAAPIAGTHPLPSFSVTKLMDQSGTTAETYFGARMNNFSFAIGDPNAPAMITFDCMTRNFDVIANPTPTYTAIRPMMNWQGFASIDGSIASFFEAADIHGNNNLAHVPNLAGVQYNRDFYPGIREVGGSVKFGYENKNNWNKMRNATEFALTINCQGLPTTAGSVITAPTYAVGAQAMPYAVQFYMPKCLFQDGGGNLNKAERMVESLPFKTANGGSGYELQIKLYNTTATFS